MRKNKRGGGGEIKEGSPEQEPFGLFGTLLYTGIGFCGLPLCQGVHTRHKSGLFLMKLRGEDILRVLNPFLISEFGKESNPAPLPPFLPV